MSVITEVGNVLSIKDEALEEALAWITPHRVVCDIGSGDDAECFEDHHWFRCQKKLNPLLIKLNEAIKA